MKDCRTFLRLHSAMDSNQGIRQGKKSMSQGYQVHRLAKHLESKVYISAMIQPVPKSKKERKSISRQVNLAISSPPATTEYLQWSDQPVRFSRADHLMRTSLYLHLLHQLLHKMFQLFSPMRLELDPLQELVLSY
jgi:hypothetical protein